MKRSMATTAAALFTLLFLSDACLAEMQCNGCHGTSGPVDYRPLDAASRNIVTGGFQGNHRTHLGNGATTSNCTICHGNGADTGTYLSRHRNGIIEMVANINNSPKAGGATYSKGVFFNQTSAPVMGTCSNVNCHFEATTPNWGNAVFTLPNDCNKCHGAPPAGGSTGAAGSHARHDLYYPGINNCQKCHSNYTTFQHATSAGKRNLKISLAGGGTYSGPLNDYLPSQTNVFGSCSNVGCHYNTTTPTWGTSTPINCFGCHTLAKMMASGSHSSHISNSLIPTMYNYTANRSTAGEHDFGCSNCHPMTNVNHVNGPVLIDLRPVAGVGRLRSKNSIAITASGVAGTVSSGTTGTPGVSVTCRNVYCHSNGFANTTSGRIYAVTPDWYGGTFTGDRCANCHGNSPNSTIPGSASHYNVNALGQDVQGGHAVGIHYKRIFKRPGGLATAGNYSTASHGKSTTATTIGCNICHYSTVTSARNDNNTICVTCHFSGNPFGALTGNSGAIADKSKHSNGIIDVSFKPVNVISKAQLRPNSFVISAYSSVWKRNAGYKVAGANDSAKSALNTATMWNSTTRTCSNVACHNGRSVKWSDNNGTTSCISCHMEM